MLPENALVVWIGSMSEGANKETGDSWPEVVDTHTTTADVTDARCQEVVTKPNSKGDESDQKAMGVVGGSQFRCDRNVHYGGCQVQEGVQVEC